MRALDEVADAIFCLRGGQFPFMPTYDLEDIFDRPLRPREWAALERSLGCLLPPLELVQGHWFLPDGIETIWDLADHVGHVHPNCEPPTVRTFAAWRNAQMFAVVRQTLVDVGSLRRKDVVREARLLKDLGLY